MAGLLPDCAANANGGRDTERFKLRLVKLTVANI